MTTGDWTPDITTIASELVTGYRCTETRDDGDQIATRTLETWQALAEDRGDGFTEAHWLALAMELAQRCA